MPLGVAKAGLTKEEFTFRPSDLFDSDDGFWYDIKPGYCYEERTGASATTLSGRKDVIGSIQDRSGNDNWATAPSDSARPILQYDDPENNLDESGSDFSGWTLSDTTVTLSSEPMPSGYDDFADEITTVDSGNSIYSTATVTASTEYTFSYYFKDVDMPGGAPTVAIYDEDGTSFISTDLTMTDTLIGDGWYRREGAFTTNSGNTTIRAYINRNAGGGSFYAFGARLDEGASAQPFNAMWAAVGDDTDDEFNFTSVSGASMTGGVAYYAGDGGGTQAFFGDSVGSQVFYWSNSLRLRSVISGTQIVGANISAETRATATFTYDGSDQAIRQDGSQTATGSETGTSDFDTFMNRGFAAMFFAGGVSQAVLINKNLTSTELANLERYLARQAKGIAI